MGDVMQPPPPGAPGPEPVVGPPTASAQAKIRLRSEYRAARTALGPAARREQSGALCDGVVDHVREILATLGPGAGRPVVAAYLGIGTEPATDVLLGNLHGIGADVVLPVCEPGYRLSWASWTPGTVPERSAHAGVLEPGGPRRDFTELSGVALILVPGLAVDRSGTRLGQGGGYYDRFLAAHPRGRAGTPTRFGMVYRDELLPADSLPADPWDQPLDGVFTPAGPVRLDAGRAV